MTTTTALVPPTHPGTRTPRPVPAATPTPTAAAPPAAAAIDAVKVYGRGEAVRALDGVTVAFAAEHFTAIMGPSGSGKSTLMHAIAGLDDLTSGRSDRRHDLPA